MVFMRPLKKGMTGSDVKQVKDRLVELGYLHASTHSTFGSDTKNAVKAYQKAMGLTVDGIVGEQTWAALIGSVPSDPTPLPPVKTAAICDLAHLYIGHPYVWGASGQENPTDDYIKSRNQTAADAQRSITFRNNIQSQGVTWMRCFDCSGFISFLMREAKLWNSRKDCDGLWKGCEPIAKEQLQPGDFLFRGSDSDKVHIGLYVGNGWCIHAKGRDAGVAKEPIDLKKEYWVYFGRWKG